VLFCSAQAHLSLNAGQIDFVDKSMLGQQLAFEKRPSPNPLLPTPNPKQIRQKSKHNDENKYHYSNLKSC
jgi:hypothetical protein